MVIFKCNSINDEDLGFAYDVIINEDDESPNSIEKSFDVRRVDGEEWLVISEPSEEGEEVELLFSSEHLHEALNFLFELEAKDREHKWYHPALYD